MYGTSLGSDVWTSPRVTMVGRLTMPRPRKQAKVRVIAFLSKNIKNLSCIIKYKHVFSIAGIMRCGPAPLTAIKEGHVYLSYDIPFVFGEVNGDRVQWVVRLDIGYLVLI